MNLSLMDILIEVKSNFTANNKCGIAGGRNSNEDNVLIYIRISYD